MKLYLLSNWGERHEDRIPIGIFSSLDKIKSHLIGEDKSIQITFREFSHPTDYGHGISLYLYYISPEKFELLCEDEKNSLEYDEYYIIEEWSLDNEKFIENQSEIYVPFRNKIENFENVNIRNVLKQEILSILKKVESNSRGLGSTEINCFLKKGNEIQMRTLIRELENEKLIYSTGMCSHKKWIIFELKDQADKIYSSFKNFDYNKE